MSRDIRIQWYRGNAGHVALQSPDVIPMQIDNMNMREANYYQGTQPIFLFNGYVNSLDYAFQFQDFVQDVNEIDPKTGNPTQYRIVNEPKVRTLSGYVMLALNKAVGT